MKKTIVTVLSTGLIAGALLAPSAEAGLRDYKRVAKKSYSVPAFGQADIGGACPPVEELDGCVTFNTKWKDRFVKVVLTDATGLPVSFTLSHPDANGDGFVESLGAFCGKSRKVALQPGSQLVVFPYMIGSTGATSSLGGPDQCPGVATQGKVKATFTYR